ncbi:MAG: hypothetical protein ACI81G_000297 [Gammaproteobacteria bacterium]|jgi:hypothetical protein
MKTSMSSLDKYWSDLPLFAFTHIKPDLDAALSEIDLAGVCHKYLIILEDSYDEKIGHSICRVILPIFEFLTGKPYALILLE